MFFASYGEVKYLAIFSLTMKFNVICATDHLFSVILSMYFMTEHSTFIFRDKYTLKLWVGHKEWVGLK